MTSLQDARPGQSEHPLDRADLRARVAKSLDAFLVSQRPALDGISEDIAPIAEAIAEFVDGGKRLRPAFCYWGWRAAGGDDCDEIMAAAASLELLQACALVHDDVMDGSDRRRGAPSVHRKFGSLHRVEGWHGNPESFGVAAAILLGDLCLVWSEQMLATSGLTDAALLRAQPVNARMRVELMTGQYLDVIEQAMGGVDVERALRVARFKAAKYTIEGPLLIGAALAGGSPAASTALSGYGLPLGEAFQLRDDVLGVFGDPGETGKPIGDDLREGKRTVLIAATLSRTDARETAIVRRHLGDPGLDTGDVEVLREIIASTGALAEVERMIAERTEQALAALAAPDLDPTAVEVLTELAGVSTTRST
ncbi:polyprenyl synthetase family protein [Acidothermaceae bacterium B102]|nr:polyprenyl synthetase family protein [Acidothermaceae bacterium B102]